MFQRSRSTRQHVRLNNLTLDSGGTYKCEVSAEAPSFRTKSAFQDMVVVVPPSKSEIVGAAPKYAVGDTVNVTCYSYRYYTNHKVFLMFCVIFVTSIEGKSWRVLSKRIGRVFLSHTRTHYL